MMKHKPHFLLITITMVVYFFVSVGLAGSNRNRTDTAEVEFVDSLLEFGAQRYRILIESLANDTTFPLSLDENNELIRVKSTHWTSGFFPGSLWYFFEFSHDYFFKQKAIQWTCLLEQEKFNKKTHDIGFIMNCSYGNAYRMTGNEEYLNILLRSAETLSSRFNSTTRCIRSWDWGKWQFPVIIDNMMNLELLYFLAEETENSFFKEIAVAHADKTLENQFRNDFSCWHVVDYNPLDGTVISKGTHQGYSDESTWTRGVAWAIYGYIISYQATKKQIYLEQVIQISDFLLNHEELPRDLIPYWDMDCPNIPNTFRDVSSATILASALVDLYIITDEKYYLNVCLKLIKTLSSDKYMAQGDENSGFLLKHSVGNLPQGTEIDVPLIYADYYFIETLIKLRRIYDKKNI